MTRPMDEARKSAREAATVKAAEVLKACFEFGGARPVRDIAGEILDAYEAALKGAGWVIVPREAVEPIAKVASREDMHGSVIGHKDMPDSQLCIITMTMGKQEYSDASLTLGDFRRLHSAMLAASEAEKG